MQTQQLTSELLSRIETIPVIDSHEHLMRESERVAGDCDVLQMLENYTSGDLIAAGCPGETVAKIVDTQGDLGERWRRLAAYWPNIRNGSYARMYLRSLRDIFGCEDLSEESVIQASAARCEANKPGWYKEVLKNRCNIAISILDRGSETDCDRELFVPAIRAETFITARTQAEIENLASSADMPIHSLNDLVTAAQRHISQSREKGAVALKVGLAYQRTLRFEKVTQHEAETLFNRIFDHLGEGLSWEEAKPLQDYMMHQCIRAATDNDLTIIFHTGIQAGGNNLISNTNPALLNNLFLEYKQTRFDLYHAGYPYAGECGILAKYFPNVWADLAWVHIISAEGTRQILGDWLDLVPANKIIGFGGDVTHVELVYGHLQQARENIAQVLGARVARGEDTEEEALQIAQYLLHDSPQEAFGLSL